MAKELIINASLPEIRIALMEDGRIQELLIERQSEKGIVGNIYKGRVTRVLPGMQAAFVDIGLDKAAFLYVDDIYVHPKVMGEDTYVHDDHHDDEDSDDEVIESRSASVGAGPKIIIQPRKTEGEVLPAEADAGSEVKQQAAEHNQEVENSVEGNSLAVTSEAQISEVTPEEKQQLAEMDSSNFESHFSEHAEHKLADDHRTDVFNEEDDSEEDESDSEDEEYFDENESEEDFDSENEIDSEGESEGEAVEASSSENSEETETPAEALVQEGGVVEPSLQGLFQAGSTTANPAKRGRGKNQRNRKRGKGGKEGRHQFAASLDETADQSLMPVMLNDSLDDRGNVESDRAQMENEGRVITQARAPKTRSEFKEPRARDRRIKSKHSRPRAQANIADLLKEGQEVIVQVAKDPIATKGARLTCHVSLPGRHLVCMPTIDHVGVSRRIERDDERRRLRDFVERNRPRKVGFIVRTASGGKDPESWIKQDIDYLSKLWFKIKVRADEVSAPALAYEDLNSVLRAIRDWVNEDIDKIIVDTRYHYNELLEFSERFMPALIEKIELYQGDIPIFDAYGLSSELHRSLERRVWLKSGGYIVIDQAEALVAIDVNTGRFVGKKNLEDTILKTNMEAAEEIAYQLRLRNCGGIIIVDFIDMERDENKLRVYRALDEALKKDRARPTIQKISDLGLVEMTRKRTRDTIIRTLCEPCVQCEGKGFSKSIQTVAYEILREIERLSIDRESKKVLVSAHEQVIDILAIDLRETLDHLERKYNKQVSLQAILDFHNEQFEVVTDRMPGKKQNTDIARQLRMERDRAERKEKQKQRQKEDDQLSEEVNSEESGERVSAPAKTPRVSIQPKTTIIAPRAAHLPVPPPHVSKKALQQMEAPKVNSTENTGIPFDVETEEEGFSEDARYQAKVAPKPTPRLTGLEDEDQLAYLRAQAAQDAALANLNKGGMASGNGAQGQQNRNGRHQNQNQRHQRNQHGRHQGAREGNQGGNGNNGRNQNQRFRQHRHQPTYPQANGNGIGAAAADQSLVQNPAPMAPMEVTVPDYEVLVKPENSGE